jgi:uncharacterized membrane protein YphA (DoxX/SURF4 family)
MSLAGPRKVDAPDTAGASRGLTWWLEQLLPRLAGILFLWTGFEKAADPTRIERVLAFDGIPAALVPGAALIVWAGEVALGLCLLSGTARRGTITVAIFVLLAFSVQLAYLIVAQDAPDCACVEILSRYQSAHQALVTGLVRNAVLASCLEWVRLRIVRRGSGSRSANERGG